MFGFDVKLMFTEKIYEIIFMLCCMHLGAVLVSFLLKWIHPYIKSCSVMHNNNEKVCFDSKCLKSDQLESLNNTLYNKKEIKTSDKNCFESNITTPEEECVRIISNHLETCVDFTDIPQEILHKQYNKREVGLLKKLSLEIDNAINIRKLIRYKLNKSKSTSGAQTNITISPTFKTDCSSPKLIFSCQSNSCDIPVHFSDSSDSFESVCSDHSETKESKFIPINHSLGKHNTKTSKGKIRNIYKERVKNDVLLDINSLTSNYKVLKANVQSLQVEKHNDYDKQVSQENKILEIAINEFENELKPIKDQIQFLKECLHGFDCCETDDSFASDLSSSVSDPITQSECYSEEMSTTCTSDLKSFSSKRYKVLARKSIPSKAEIQYNGYKPNFDENTRLIPKSKYEISTSKSHEMIQSADKHTSKGSKQICILEIGQSANESSVLNKRSPIADMYIKLSHCSSNTANFVKSNYHKSADKSVTCHINLNFNLGAVTLSSTSIKNYIKEREMQPVLSQPEDILDKILQTQIPPNSGKNDKIENL